MPALLGFWVVCWGLRFQVEGSGSWVKGSGSGCKPSTLSRVKGPGKLFQQRFSFKCVPYGTWDMIGLPV